MHVGILHNCEPNYVPTFQFNLRNIKILEFALDWAS